MPIVDDPFDFGRIAATNAISDVYAMGGTPILALAPGGHAHQRAAAGDHWPHPRRRRIRLQGSRYTHCRGHTIDSVEPIYGLVALGLVHPSRVKRNADARVGDRLVLGKPLGVGIPSAALKKEQLDAAGYQRMIATTTQLNTPGPELAAPSAHAITDVTGFGLAGHALEMARGARCTVQVDWARVPLVEGVRSGRCGLCDRASGRNWAAYGHEVQLPPTLPLWDQALLSDPQTSGGLLVSCAAGGGPGAGRVPASRV